MGEGCESAIWDLVLHTHVCAKCVSLVCTCIGRRDRKAMAFYEKVFGNFSSKRIERGELNINHGHGYLDRSVGVASTGKLRQKR